MAGGSPVVSLCRACHEGVHRGEYKYKIVHDGAERLRLRASRWMREVPAFGDPPRDQDPWLFWQDQIRELVRDLEAAGVEP